MKTSAHATQRAAMKHLSVSKFLAAVVAVLILGPVAEAVIIDDFQTAQGPFSLATPGNVGNTAGNTVTPAPGAIGNAREYELLLLADPSSNGVTLQTSGGLLSLSAGTDARGRGLATWPGSGGLGGVDLTGGGHTGIRLLVSSSTAPGAEVEIEVFTDAGNSSRAALVLPTVASPTEFILSFSNDFVTRLGAGADFTNVDKISLTLRAKSLALNIDLIETVKPSYTMTKIAVLNDLDGDNLADPGETISYKITLSNTGAGSTGVSVDDTIDGNTSAVTNSLFTSPIAFRDSYSAFGNMTLTASAASGVLANDSDADGEAFSVTSFDASSVQGGTVSVNPDGSLTYDPPAGFKGVDSFTYTITDAGARTATGTVSVVIDGTVWFVKNDHGGPFQGTQANPFHQLALAEAASGSGDIIFVYEGDGTTTGHNAGITLQDDQQLIGEGVGLTLGAQVIVPAGSRPVIGNPGGNGITLAQNNTVQGLDVGTTSGMGFKNSGMATVGNLSVDNVTISGGGGIINLDGGGTLAVTFDNVTSTGSATRGMNLTGVGGSLTVTGTTTLDGSADRAVNVSGAQAGAAFDFGATLIGLTTAAAIGVDLASSSSASFTFDSLDVTTAAGVALRANAAGTLDIAGTTNTLVAVGGSAVDLVNTSLGTGGTFDSVSVSGNPTIGVNLSGVNGAFAANGGALTTTTAAAVVVSGGSDAVSIGANITNTSGRSVEITGRTGQTVEIFGAINDTGSGILVQNNTAGTSRFSGATKTVNTGSNTGITLAANTGHTVDFSNGGLAVTTINATGFSATGGGTISVQGAGNSISTTSARALDVNSTAISGSGMTFQSISASGTTKGIVLATAGTGGLTVTGSGSTDASGGTIQSITQRGVEVSSSSNINLSNMRFSNAGTANQGSCDALTNTGCSASIHLSAVTGVTLTNVDIDASVALAQQGINGVNVTDFNLVDSTVTKCGNAVNEGCLRIVELLGTSAITNSDLSFAAEKVAWIKNSAGTLNLTVSGSTFRDTQSSPVGADGLEIGANGAATVNLDVVNSSFLRNETKGVQVLAEGSSTVSADLTGSIFDRGSGPGIGIDLAANNSANLDFNILNNPLINSRNSHPVNIFADVNSSVEGRINNNTNIQCDPALGGNGIRLQIDGNATGVVEINGNTLSNIGNGSGIQAGSRGDTDATPSGRLDVTISNNSIASGSSSFANIYVRAQDKNTTCANVNGNSGSLGGAFPFAFAVRAAEATSTVFLPGSGANATALWTNNGNAPAGPVAEGGSGTITIGGSCPLPTNPMP